jgi:hypothetical protein
VLLEEHAAVVGLLGGGRVVGEPLRADREEVVVHDLSDDIINHNINHIITL